MSALPLIHDLSLDALQSLVEHWNEPAYRAQQIWQALYQRMVPSAEDMTELPASLRERLAGSFAFPPTTPLRSTRSSDGNTEKALLSLSDGRSVEAVLMRYDRRHTICVSTQVGCAMGCPFCATGQMGLVRDLSAGEIVAQVLYYSRQLQPEGRRLDNIVMMGMGEPFHNYEALAQALRMLNHDKGLRFGARRMTVSTVGLIPGIKRFGEDFPQINLAVSLHAATNDVRNRLIPANKRYPLDALIPACREHVQKTGRRITFEWALIRETNDGVDQAEALASLAKTLTCHVNLIPLNPTPAFGERTSSQARCDEFAGVLSRSGVSHSFRLRRGLDIDAGCGQLAIKVDQSRA